MKQSMELVFEGIKSRMVEDLRSERARISGGIGRHKLRLEGAHEELRVAINDERCGETIDDHEMM